MGVLGPGRFEDSLRIWFRFLAGASPCCLYLSHQNTPLKIKIKIMPSCPFPQVSELELTGKNKDRIEIALGPTNVTNAKNFLRTDPDVPNGRGMFIIRQTFM